MTSSNSVRTPVVTNMNPSLLGRPFRGFLRDVPRGSPDPWRLLRTSDLGCRAGSCVSGLLRSACFFLTLPRLAAQLKGYTSFRQ